MYKIAYNNYIIRIIHYLVNILLNFCINNDYYNEKYSKNLNYCFNKIYLLNQVYSGFSAMSIFLADFPLK